MLAVGMVMVIIAGHIDLSVGSVAAFVGIVVAQSMYVFDVPWPVAMLSGSRSVRSSGPGRGGGSPTSAFPPSS